MPFDRIILVPSFGCSCALLATCHMPHTNDLNSRYSISFIIELVTGSGNLLVVNAIDALTGCRASMGGKNGTCSVGSQRCQFYKHLSAAAFCGACCSRIAAAPLSIVRVHYKGVVTHPAFIIVEHDSWKFLGTPGFDTSSHLLNRIHWIFF